MTTNSDQSDGDMASAQKLIRLFYNKCGQLEREQVTLACDHLRRKGVIIVPTDTLYGLAARVEDTEALERIYEIKGRQQDKPLAVCVSTIEEVKDIADTSKLKEPVLRALFPGAVTLVLKRSESLNKNLNPGLATIGVRIPDNNFIRALANEVGPLALTSANRSGEPDPVTFHQCQGLLDKVDCAFDMGLLQRYLEYDPTITKRLGSTVVEVTDSRRFRIIRGGMAKHRTVSFLQRFGYRPEKDQADKKI